jgi:mono/diheme cytochrome c family protein
MKTRLWSVALATVLVPLMAMAQADKKTERTWKSKCASCHGADGKGQTDQGKKMKVHDYTKADWQKSRKDDDLKKAIADGVNREKDGVKQEMPGFKDSVPPEEIDNLVKYVRSFGTQKKAKKSKK